MADLRRNIVTRTFHSDGLMETAYSDYIEVTSKDTGGPVQSFRCPNCRAIFDASLDAQFAFDSCVAHSKTCSFATPRDLARLTNAIQNMRLDSESTVLRRLSVLRESIADEIRDKQT